eukprot:15444728-Alexandrium_andersonii.AAC.1
MSAHIPWVFDPCSATALLRSRPDPWPEHSGTSAGPLRTPAVASARPGTQTLLAGVEWAR